MREEIRTTQPKTKASLSLKINEVFYSIQGESRLSGEPTIFIRLSGCHLRCTYCDTTSAYYEGEFLTPQEIFDEISKHPCQRVCVTGGEPLLQKAIFPFMTELCDRGYQVSLETAGDKDCALVDPRVLKVIDVKTPGSGEVEKFALENLRFADASTDFKFVICSDDDFDWTVRFCQFHDLFSKTSVYFSPSFGEYKEERLAERLLQSGVPARLQIQMHKYIWDPNLKGV